MLMTLKRAEQHGVAMTAHIERCLVLDDRRHILLICGGSVIMQ